VKEKHGETGWVWEIEIDKNIKEGREERNGFLVGGGGQADTGVVEVKTEYPQGEGRETTTSWRRLQGEGVDFRSSGKAALAGKGTIKRCDIN